jgi:hypothetical protein
MPVAKHQRRLRFGIFGPIARFHILLQSVDFSVQRI